LYEGIFSSSLDAPVSFIGMEILVQVPECTRFAGASPELAVELQSRLGVVKLDLQSGIRASLQPSPTLPPIENHDAPQVHVFQGVLVHGDRVLPDAADYHSRIGLDSVKRIHVGEWTFFGVFGFQETALYGIRDTPEPVGDKRPLEDGDEAPAPKRSKQTGSLREQAVAHILTPRDVAWPGSPISWLDRALTFRPDASLFSFLSPTDAPTRPLGLAAPIRPDEIAPLLRHNGFETVGALESVENCAVLPNGSLLVPRFLGVWVLYEWPSAEPWHPSGTGFYHDAPASANSRVVFRDDRVVWTTDTRLSVLRLDGAPILEEEDHAAVSGEAAVPAAAVAGRPDAGRVLGVFAGRWTTTVVQESAITVLDTRHPSARWTTPVPGPKLTSARLAPGMLDPEGGLRTDLNGDFRQRISEQQERAWLAAQPEESAALWVTREDGSLAISGVLGAPEWSWVFETEGQVLLPADATPTGIPPIARAGLALQQALYPAGPNPYAFMSGVLGQVFLTLGPELPAPLQGAALAVGIYSAGYEVAAAAMSNNPVATATLLLWTGMTVYQNLQVFRETGRFLVRVAESPFSGRTLLERWVNSNSTDLGRLRRALAKLGSPPRVVDMIQQKMYSRVVERLRQQGVPAWELIDLCRPLVCRSGSRPKHAAQLLVPVYQEYVRGPDDWRKRAVVAYRYLKARQPGVDKCELFSDATQAALLAATSTKRPVTGLSLEPVVWQALVETFET
jgi:hypothetical protein